MSRIDEALKRLAGVSTPEPRPAAPTLERYASEGKARIEETKRQARFEEHKARIEEHRVAAFTAAAGPRPVEVRSAAPPPAIAPAQAVAPVSEPSVDPEVAGETDPLIDVRLVVDYVGFVARSVRRHKMIAAAVVTLIIGLTTAAAFLFPKTYHVQAKLLAQRNAVMVALSNPGRAVPWDADAPTRAAAETVLRRDNLISLIAQTDLIREYKRTREPILRLKDWVVTVVTQSTPTPDEELDALIGMLETRMKVEAGPVGDGTVSIDLDWRDAEMAYKLVQAAQQAFLEARQLAETAAIGESISILERYSSTLRDNINRNLAEMERTQAQSKTGRRVRVTPRLAAAIGGPTPALLPNPLVVDNSLDRDPTLSKMKGSIASKRLELARLEEARQRQLSEAQSKLSQLMTVYTANHPSVLSAQQNVASLAQNSPQALALAAEIEEIQADYDKQLGDATDLQVRELSRRSPAPASTTATVRPVEPEQPAAAEPADDPTSATSQFARLSLRSELNQLESVLERTDGARIELAVSQAAFKYRYTVIRPAQVPRDPVSPNLKLVIVAGALASLLFAIVVAVIMDLLSGRILEPWQIERQLGLPVLGTLRQA